MLYKNNEKPFKLWIKKNNSMDINRTTPECFNNLENVLSRILKNGYKIQVGFCDDVFFAKMLQFSSDFILSPEEYTNKGYILITNTANVLQELNLVEVFSKELLLLYAINKLKNEVYFKEFVLLSDFFGTITNINEAKKTTQKMSYEELAEITEIGCSTLRQLRNRDDKMGALLDIITLLDKDFVKSFFAEYKKPKTGVRASKKPS